MIFYSNNITFLKQCSHCKRTGYKKLMCWNKYLHKKKKFEVTKKKKNEKSDESDDKFSDNFTLNSNSTLNLTLKSFSNTKSMSVTDQHPLSVWIINTETSNHLCFMWKFFSSYKSVVQSLKTVNRPAQIIKKSTVLLCLKCSDSDIQKVILCDVMHVSYSSANLISDHCMQSDNVIFDMTDCTLHYNNDVIKHVSEVNE